MSFKVLITSASMLNQPVKIRSMSRVALLNVTMPTLSIGRLLKVLLGSKSHTDIYSTFGSSTDAFLMPLKKVSDDIFATQRVDKQATKKFFDTAELFESVHTTRAVIPKDSIGVSTDPIALGYFKKPQSNLSLRSQLHFSYGITLGEQTASVLAGIDSLFSTKGLFDTTGINEDIWAGQAKIKTSRTSISHLSKKYNTLAFITDEPEYIEPVPGVTGGQFAYIITDQDRPATLFFNTSVASFRLGDALDAIQTGGAALIQQTWTGLDRPTVIGIDTENNSVLFDKTISTIFQGVGATIAVVSRTAQPYSPGYSVGSLDRLGTRSSTSSLIKKWAKTRKASSASTSSKIYANYAVYNKDTVEHSELIKKFVTKAPQFSSTELEGLVSKMPMLRKASSAHTDVRTHTNYSVYNKETIEYSELIKKFVKKAPRFSSTEIAELVWKIPMLKKFSSASTDVRTHTNYSVYNKETIEYSELIKKYISKPRFSSAEIAGLVSKMPMLKKFSAGSVKTEVIAAGASTFKKDKVYSSHLLKKDLDVQFKQDVPPLNLNNIILIQPLEQTYVHFGGYRHYHDEDGNSISEPIYIPKYNKAFLSSVQNIRAMYSYYQAARGFGDRIAFYNNSESTTPTYVGYIHQVGSNWVRFSSSSSPYLSTASFNDNSIHFDEFTDIRIIRDPITRFSYYDADAEATLIDERPRETGLDRRLTRVGANSGFDQRTGDWKGVGIAFGIKQNAYDNSNAQSLLIEAAYSKLGRTQLGLDNSQFKKRFVKKLLDKAVIHNLVKKYVIKQPFDMGFDIAITSHQNYSVYNKVASNIDASLVTKYVDKAIPVSFSTAASQLLEKYINIKKLSLAGIVSRSYESRSRLIKSSSSTSVTLQKQAMKRFGDSDPVTTATHFDRIAEYHRDFTTDSVSADNTVSIFRQNYANSYFAEDYVGHAITS